MISSLFSWLSGKKTYFVAVGMIAYAAFGWWIGQMDQTQAMALVFNALGIAGLRHGVKTSTEL